MLHVYDLMDWLQANKGPRKHYIHFHTTKHVTLLCLPRRLPQPTLVCLVKPILHAQRSAKVTVTARNTGQAIFQCPEPVPARVTTSLCIASPKCTVHTAVCTVVFESCIV
eukprot:6180051-Pleurochrysis_carterae.AAC.2